MGIEPFRPTNLYHRRSAGDGPALRTDRKYPLPEIRNPNLQTPGTGGSGSGGDMRSTIVFTLLMLVVLLGFQYFRPTPSTPAPATQNQSQAAQPSGLGAAQGQQAQPQMAAGSKQAPAATPAVAAAVETDTTVENERYKIVFTNRGAQVKSWILKGYYDTGGYKGGHPLDLVQPQVAARFGYPLSLFTYEPALTTQLNQALYQVATSGAPPTATSLVLAPNALTFHYAANGLDVVKTFRFDSTYVVTVETQVKRNGAPVRALVAWPGGLGDMEEFLPSSQTRSTARTSASSQFAWSLEGKQDSMSAAKVSGDATIDQPYQYASIIDLYFAAAFLPDNPAGATLVTLHNTYDLPTDLSDPNSPKKPADVIGLAAGDQSGYTRLRLFAGPKAMDTLRSIHAIGADGKPSGPSLEPLIQFGWLTIIAKPLYLALRFLRNMLGQGAFTWGWAIIIFTVIFNMLMLPTRIMTMKSSLKMMRIQPKVEAIRQPQGERPQAGRDEHRDDGPLQERGRQHVRRLPAAAGADAAVLRLLPRAGQRDRTAPGPLVLAHRSLFAGSPVHSAHSHHRHHVPGAVHHPLAGHGPDSAQDDGDHDAGHLRLLDAALRLGAGALLGFQQHHQPLHSDRHQSVQGRQGDARYRRQARRQEDRGQSKDDSGTALDRITPAQTPRSSPA